MIDKIYLEKEKTIQFSWDFSNLKNVESLILFFAPVKIKINGGVMLIYFLCQMSRELNKDSACVLSTYPNEKDTYSLNNRIPNEEKFYRFSQIVDNCKNLMKTIINILEYYAKDFYSNLKGTDLLVVDDLKNKVLCLPYYGNLNENETNNYTNHCEKVKKEFKEKLTIRGLNGKFLYKKRNRNCWI